jgi:hypothetical protein
MMLPACNPRNRSLQSLLSTNQYLSRSLATRLYSHLNPGSYLRRSHISPSGRERGMLDKGQTVINQIECRFANNICFRLHQPFSASNSRVLTHERWMSSSSPTEITRPIWLANISAANDFSNSELSRALIGLLNQKSFRFIDS